MARIPRYTNKLGNRKCRGCEKRRICYVPTDDAEYKALGDPGKLCGECLTTARWAYLTPAIRKVLSEHTASRHAFDGATVVTQGNTVSLVPPKSPPTGRFGYSCFVWVSTVAGRECFSEGCLSEGPTFYADLKAIPGVLGAHVNLD